MVEMGRSSDYPTKLANINGKTWQIKPPKTLITWTTQPISDFIRVPLQRTLVPFVRADGFW